MELTGAAARTCFAAVWFRSLKARLLAWRFHGLARTDVWAQATWATWHSPGSGIEFSSQTIVSSPERALARMTCLARKAGVSMIPERPVSRLLQAAQAVG